MPNEVISADKIRELLAQGYSVERIKREYGGSKDRIRSIRDQSDMPSSFSHGATKSTDNSRKDDQGSVSESSRTNLSTDLKRPTDHIDEKEWHWYAIWPNEISSTLRPCKQCEYLKSNVCYADVCVPVPIGKSLISTDRPTDLSNEKKLCLSQVVITVPDKQNFQRCLHSGRMNLELKMWLWKNSQVE